jgi:hypothetical protein
LSIRYIGVGVRSQNYYAGFGHIVYLNRDGSVIMAQPDESAAGFTDLPLRPPTPIDVSADHAFEIVFTRSKMVVSVDDFTTAFTIADMPKVLGAGLIRFQSHLAWMSIRSLRLSPE